MGSSQAARSALRRRLQAEQRARASLQSLRTRKGGGYATLTMLTMVGSRLSISHKPHTSTGSDAVILSTCDTLSTAQVLAARSASSCASKLHGHPSFAPSPPDPDACHPAARLIFLHRSFPACCSCP